MGTRKEISISTFAQLLEETATDELHSNNPAFKGWWEGLSSTEQDGIKTTLTEAFGKAMELCPLSTVGENENFYLPDYGVPTIQLGDGGTIVSDVIGDDGFHGICFTEAEVNKGVGGDQSEQVGGKKVDDIGAYFQILTDNPASLNVLIDQCQRAKAALEAPELPHFDEAWGGGVGVDVCKGRYVVVYGNEEKFVFSSQRYFSYLDAVASIIEEQREDA